MSKLSVAIDGTVFEIELDRHASTTSELTVVVNHETVRVKVSDLDHPEQGIWLLVDDRPYEITIDRHFRSIASAYGLHQLTIRDGETSVFRPSSANGCVRAPIPGCITQVLVATGDYVEVGQPLVVLEAMKMENQITAPRTGVVDQVHVSPGQAVARQALLAEIVSAKELSAAAPAPDPMLSMC